MRADEFQVLLDAASKRRKDLRKNKGEEYTRGSEDILQNFKDAAKDLGLQPMQVWWVYAKKHLDAVANYIRTGREASNEGIEGRIDDLQVYLDLLRGLVAEHKGPKPGGVKMYDKVEFQQVVKGSCGDPSCGCRFEQARPEPKVLPTEHKFRPRIVDRE